MLIHSGQDIEGLLSTHRQVSQTGFLLEPSHQVPDSTHLDQWGAILQGRCLDERTFP